MRPQRVDLQSTATALGYAIAAARHLPRRSQIEAGLKALPEPLRGVPGSSLFVSRLLDSISDPGPRYWPSTEAELVRTVALQSLREWMWDEHAPDGPGRVPGLRIGDWQWDRLAGRADQ